MSLIAQKLISASGATAATEDPDFPLVTGLYHFDGSNGAQNNTFTGVGASGASQSWTRNGSPTQGSFSPFSSEEGKWSVFFDGTDDYIDVASGATQLGSGDLTVEFWIKTGDTSFNLANPDDSTGSGYWGILMQSGDLRWNDSYAVSNKWVVDGAALTDNQWHHVAIVRASGTFAVYYDGTSQSIQSGSFSDSTNYSGSDVLRIGKGYGAGTLDEFQGFLSNFRTVSGTAVYTGNYTTPSTPLTAITNTKVLVCCSNRFKDKSTNAYAVSTGSAPKIQPFSPFAPSAAYDASTMGGSGHFANATSDSISFSDSSMALGNGDFTIEGWFYFDGNYSAGVGLFQQENGLNGPALGWWPGGSNGWQFYYGSGTWSHATGATARMYEWTHIAYVRSSGVVNLYVNGVKATSNISDSTNYASTNFVIGQFYSSGYTMEGYISNFKVSLNAIYTSAFTPPTALVTPTSGGSSAASTKILVDFTNAGIIDSSRKTNVLTVGNAQLDTSVKKFGTASAEFDGTGDRLVLSNKDLAPVGTQSFTIECFIYVNANKNYNGIYSAGVGIQMYVNSSGKLQCWLGSSTSSFFVNGLESTTTIPTSTWRHIALVRDSSANTVTWFVEGLEKGQQTSVTDSVMGMSTFAHTIGSYQAGTYSMNGYIDEFRITNKARYTSNFTAPTKEFPNL